MKIFLAILSSSLILGCESAQKTDSAPLNTTAAPLPSPLATDYGKSHAILAPIEPTAYEKAIDDHSAGEEQYSGFYNLMAYRATLLNTDLIEMVLRREAEFYGWDQARYDSERTARLKRAESETVVHVSFFVPDRKNDNLGDRNTIWRIFLDANGKRYQGTAKKKKKLFAEIKSVFPYHSRWTTPYEITFPVDAKSFDKTPATLTITGPVGSRTVDFKP